MESLNSNHESKKKALVFRELEMVENRLEGVQSIIKDLLVRLAPIMSPQQQGEPVDDSNEPLEVPLANRLKMLGRGLGNSIDSLKSIFERLGI